MHDLTYLGGDYHEREAIRNKEEFSFHQCRSMVDIQSPTAEIRRGKKEERKKETTAKNILACPIT